MPTDKSLQVQHDCQRMAAARAARRQDKGNTSQPADSNVGAPGTQKYRKNHFREPVKPGELHGAKAKRSFRLHGRHLRGATFATIEEYERRLNQRRAVRCFDYVTKHGAYYTTGTNERTEHFKASYTIEMTLEDLVSRSAATIKEQASAWEKAKTLLNPDVPTRKESGIWHDPNSKLALLYVSLHKSPVTGERVNDGIPVSDC